MYQPKPIAGMGPTHGNSIALNKQAELARNGVGSPNDASNSASAASRQRLRWTNELHERFVDAVAQLGGPDSKFLLPHLFDLNHSFSFSFSLIRLCKAIQAI